MRRTTLLKSYIEDPEILVMPGAHDTLTATIVEQAGFKAVTIGGYAASASLLGRPDVSLLTLTEMVEFVRRMVDAVHIPVFADGDTGHGGVLNVIRTVREMERSGAAGMFIEDQDFPKRCGHMEGKEVIAREEMVAKVKAAVDARVDPDFIIMARTDALAVEGIDAAVERANAYREAGADLLFVEAPESVEHMRVITRGVRGPCLANNIEGGKSPVLSAHELQDIGYSVVVFPVAVTYAVARATQDLMVALRDTGTTRPMWDRMVDFQEFARIVDLAGLRQMEKRYAVDRNPAG
jgi:2-methylisocitrate lyase-like PEP mutase family enzyme